MGSCCCDSNRAKQKPQQELVKEAQFELFQTQTEYCISEAGEETRDEVILDLHSSIVGDNFFHSTKHSRRKTFTHFDVSHSSESFQSIDFS